MVYVSFGVVFLKSAVCFAEPAVFNQHQYGKVHLAMFRKVNFAVQILYGKVHFAICLVEK